MTKLRIYVAGPYTATTRVDLERNAMKAIDAGIAILKKGHTPFIPHLTHYVDLRAREINVEITWAEYMRWDEAWLDQCDAILYLGPSKGADIELEKAKVSGKRIFYRLTEIPDAISGPGVTHVSAAQR